MVDLQQMPRATAPLRLRIDVAAAALIPLPHFPLGRGRDRPRLRRGNGCSGRLLGRLRWRSAVGGRRRARLRRRSNVAAGVSMRRRHRRRWRSALGTGGPPAVAAGTGRPAGVVPIERILPPHQRPVRHRRVHVRQQPLELLQPALTLRVDHHLQLDARRPADAAACQLGIHPRASPGGCSCRPGPSACRAETSSTGVGSGSCVSAAADGREPACGVVDPASAAAPGERRRWVRLRS